jgi:protein-S-isoprenylcysteine O-methyltransferase Ste14
MFVKRQHEPMLRNIVVWTLIRVAAAVACGAWVVLQLRRWDHLFHFALPEWFKIPGIILTCGGGIVVLLCGASLATRGIFEQRGDRLTPRSLETSGPFRYSRNPMSLGIVALFAGLGFFCLSLTIVVFSGLLFLLAHLWVISVEEPKLLARFGQVYRDYQRCTNRWLPALRQVKIIFQPNHRGHGGSPGKS